MLEQRFPFGSDKVNMVGNETGTGEKGKNTRCRHAKRRTQPCADSNPGNSEGRYFGFSNWNFIGYWYLVIGASVDYHVLRIGWASVLNVRCSKSKALSCETRR